MSSRRSLCLIWLNKGESLFNCCGFSAKSYNSWLKPDGWVRSHGNINQKVLRDHPRCGESCPGRDWGLVTLGHVQVEGYPQVHPVLSWSLIMTGGYLLILPWVLPWIGQNQWYPPLPPTGPGQEDREFLPVDRQKGLKTLPSRTLRLRAIINLIQWLNTEITILWWPWEKI